MYLHDMVHLDPLFAAGAGSFSNGIETLIVDSWITTPSELEEFVLDSLENRWNTFDRIFMARAWTADWEFRGET